MVVAYLYVQEYYGNQTEFKVRQMIQYLKKAFELVVHEQPWLPDSFKHELVEKVITFFLIFIKTFKYDIVIFELVCQKF